GQREWLVEPAVLDAQLIEETQRLAGGGSGGPGGGAWPCLRGGGQGKQDLARWPGGAGGGGVKTGGKVEEEETGGARWGGGGVEAGAGWLSSAGCGARVRGGTGAWAAEESVGFGEARRTVTGPPGASAVGGKPLPQHRR